MKEKFSLEPWTPLKCLLSFPPWADYPWVGGSHPKGELSGRPHTGNPLRGVGVPCNKLHDIRERTENHPIQWMYRCLMGVVALSLGPNPPFSSLHRSERKVLARARVAVALK